MGALVPNETVRIKGFRELQRAFALADPALKKRFRETLVDAAAPVAHDAELLATAGIRNIGVEWSRMRVGVTAKSVYVAPRRAGSRTGKQKRRNLADLLLGRSMFPSLSRNESRTFAATEHMLDVLGSDWERV